MPTVSIEMFTGRTDEQKAQLVSELTDAVVAALGVDSQLVRVKIYEIERRHSATGGQMASSAVDSGGN
ncbi:MAG: tautomerase family protein [Rhodococcus sp. (in: high G+C Gram-positive bacteria)]